MSADPHLTRRQLIATSLLGLVAGPVMAQASLDPKDPSAIALGYTRNHQQVDKRRWRKKANEKPDAPQRCASCAQRSEDGSCRLFKGQRVADNGWCNAWTPR